MRRIFILMIISLVMLGCNRWKETARLNFYFGVGETEESASDITFERGTISLVQIGIKGDRLQSGDIGFIEELGDNFSVNLPTGVANQELYYEMPQGTYRTIDVTLWMESMVDSVPTISLKGSFVDSLGHSHPFLFESKGRVEAKLISKFPGDRDDYSILQSSKRQAQVQFVLEEWFSPVSATMLEAADTYMLNGEEVIWITEEANVDIYTVILPRIGTFDEVQFE